jgi:hypothetical protein
MSTAVSFVLEFQIDERRRAELTEMLPQGELVDAFARGAQRFEVLLSEEATRVSAASGQMLGYDWALIRQQGQPTIWLSTKSRHFLKLPEDRIAGCAFSDSYECQVESTREPDTVDDFTLELVVVSLRDRFTNRRHTQRLWISQDDRLRPFAKEISTLLFGGTDCHEASGYPISEIASLGAPLRGEFYTGDGTLPFSSFRLENLQILDVLPEAFVVPADYTDLNENIRSGRWPDKNQPGLEPVRPLTIRSDGYWEFAKESDTLPDNRPDAPSPDLGQGKYELTAGPVTGPECLPSTRGSIISLEVTQSLFDYLMELLNHISRRLTGFQGSNGKIIVNWLEQFKNHALSRTPPMGNGASLYCALRDEPVPLAAVNTPEHVGGRGWLDKEAESVARSRLSTNNLASLGLDPVMLQRITDPAFGGNFDSLTPDDQRDLREQVLAKDFAAPELAYTNSTPFQKVFYDLLYVRVSNIDFTFAINNTAIFSPISIGPSGTVTLTITLPSAMGSAEIVRLPSEVYLAYVFLTLVGCVSFPLLCWLIGPLTAVGVIILADWASAQVSMTGITMTLTVSPTVDSDQFIRPKVSAVVAVTSISTTYISYVPTGIHQLVAIIYTIILDLIAKLVLPSLVQDLTAKLTAGLAKYTFPIGIEGMGFTPLSSRVAGVATVPATAATPRALGHIYLETEVEPVTGLEVNPFITQVDLNPEVTLIPEAAKFSAAGSGAHFLSLAISQNFINQYLLGLWANGEFNYNSFSPSELATLSNLLPSGGPIPPGSQIEVSWWPATPPRIQIAPVLASQGNNYLLAFFDDVRLCIHQRFVSLLNAQVTLGPAFEILFAMRLGAQLGFGRVPSGPITASTRLQLLKGSFRAFDLFLDLNPSHIALGPVGIFDLNSAAALAPGILSGIANYEQLLRRATMIALAGRPDTLIGRMPANPLTHQVYALDEKSPASSVNRVNIELLPRRGIVYVHAGVITLLNALLERTSMGTLLVNPDTLNCAFGKGLWPKP